LSIMSKPLLRDMLRPLILVMLCEKPMHGYQLIERIRDVTGFTFGPGVVYPLLYKLEEKGLIRGEWIERGVRRRVRIYRLTEEGRKMVREVRELLEKVYSMLVS